MTSIPVKAGDEFTIPFLVQNTDPSVWGSDSFEFKPERWIKEGGLPQSSELPTGPFSNISNFVDGPRLCIGWRLGMPIYLFC